MVDQRIVITGEGIVSAIGNNKDDVARQLRKKRTGIGPMRYLKSRCRDLPVGEVKLTNEEMKALLGIPASQTMSRTTLMGIMAVRQAIEEANVKKDDRLRIVLISGTTVGGMDITEQLPPDSGKPETIDWFLGHSVW